MANEKAAKRKQLIGEEKRNKKKENLIDFEKNEPRPSGIDDKWLQQLKPMEKYLQSKISSGRLTALMTGVLESNFTPIWITSPNAVLSICKGPLV